MMKITDYHIILASNSPRRKELLSGIDILYKVRIVSEVDETYPDDLPQELIPEYLAKKKAAASFNGLQADELLITADTIVLLDNKVLGKPKDRNEVELMLRQLSGKTHLVITGVCLTSRNKQVSFSDTTKVTFAELNDDEIDYYARNYNPTDKAGAYGVQEWIGFVGVESLEGSYFNVMGLPIRRVYEAIKEF